MPLKSGEQRQLFCVVSQDLTTALATYAHCAYSAPKCQLLSAANHEFTAKNAYIAIRIGSQASDVDGRFSRWDDNNRCGR